MELTTVQTVRDGREHQRTTIGRCGCGHSVFFLQSVQQLNLPERSGGFAFAKTRSAAFCRIAIARGPRTSASGLRASCAARHQAGRRRCSRPIDEPRGARVPPAAGVRRVRRRLSGTEGHLSCPDSSESESSLTAHTHTGRFRFTRRDAGCGTPVLRVWTKAS